MSTKTGIEWTDATWNPVTGCSKVSQGCKNCYALREWPRLSAPRPKPNVYTGRAFTDVAEHMDRLEQPLHWTKPRRIFVNSMSDLFHEAVSNEFIADVFGVMAAAHWHTFQVLTKRAARMRQLLNDPIFRDSMEESAALYTHTEPTWPLPNVWLCVSAEDQATANERIPQLLATPAAVRGISAEPLLGPVDLRDGLGLMGSPGDVDWVIVGGESGPQARPCNISWLRSIVQQCRSAGVAAFVKQLGAQPRGWCVSRLHIEPADQADLDDDYCDAYEAHEFSQSCDRCAMLVDKKGADPTEWPEDLRVQEMPRV